MDPQFSWMDDALRLGAGLLLVWVGRTVQQLALEVRGMRAHLFGETGDNGMNGKVRSLEQQLTDHADELHGVRRDVEHIRSDLEYLKVKVS